MTTAKPPQTSGNGDAADDLIAELAKLMAKDAQGDRSVAAPRSAAPMPSTPPPMRAVRIPGSSIDETPPKSSENQAARPDEVSSEASAGTRNKEAAADPSASELFNFDLGFDKDPALEAAASEPHDAIADLIAAETDDTTAEVGPETDDLAGVAPIADTPVLKPNTPISRANVQPADGSLAAASGERRDDNFNVPPIFGVGSGDSTPRSTPKTGSAEAALHTEAVVDNVTRVDRQQNFRQEPQMGSPGEQAEEEIDPISEIENLIGKAVRVTLDPSEQQPPTPSEHDTAAPVAAQVGVGLNKAVRVDPQIDSADAAIMAAAKDAGTQVDWANADETDDSEPIAKRRGGGWANGAMRAFAGPVVAIGLLLVAGLGLYWVLGLGGAQSGDVPTLTADTSPTKGVPEPQAADTKAQPSVVFNEIDGVDSTGNEKLVSRDQSQPSDAVTAVTTPSADEGLVNRKVRTVTVRPDGTIVSGDDAVAGNAILPVDRPNVPAVPGAEEPSAQLQAAIADQAPAAVGTPQPSAVPATPGSTIPAVDENGAPIPGKTAPVPMVRPQNFTNTNSTSAPLATVASPQASVPQTATSSSSDAPAYVQLSSQRSEADAQASATRVQRQYGSLFGGENLKIQRVDLGEKGIYYRVLLPSTSLQNATQVCSTIKTNGGDCFAF